LGTFRSWCKFELYLDKTLGSIHLTDLSNIQVIMSATQQTVFGSEVTTGNHAAKT